MEIDKSRTAQNDENSSVKFYGVFLCGWLRPSYDIPYIVSIRL